MAELCCHTPILWRARNLRNSPESASKYAHVSKSSKGWRLNRGFLKYHRMESRLFGSEQEAALEYARTRRILLQNQEGGLIKSHSETCVPPGGNTHEILAGNNSANLNQQFPFVITNDGGFECSARIRLGLSGGVCPFPALDLRKDSTFCLRRSQQIWQPSLQTHLIFQAYASRKYPFRPPVHQLKSRKTSELDQSVVNQLKYFQRHCIDCYIPVDFLVSLLQSELNSQAARLSFDPKEGGLVQICPDLGGVPIVLWATTTPPNLSVHDSQPSLNRLACAEICELLSKGSQTPHSAWLDFDFELLQIEQVALPHKQAVCGQLTIAVRTMLKVHLVDVDRITSLGVSLSLRASLKLPSSCSVNMATHPLLASEVATISANDKIHVWDLRFATHTAHKPIEAVGFEKNFKLPFVTERVSPICSVEFPSTSCEEIYTHRDYRQCQYGAHPRVLWLANSEALYALDLRASSKTIEQYCEPVEKYDSPRSIGAMQRQNSNPFHILLGTTQHVRLIDSRMPRQALVEWDHELASAPRILRVCDVPNTSSSSIAPTSKRHTSFVCGCEYGYTDSQGFELAPLVKSSTSRQVFCLSYDHQQSGSRNFGPCNLTLPSWTELPRLRCPQRLRGIDAIFFGSSSPTAHVFVSTDSGDLILQKFSEMPVDASLKDKAQSVVDDYLHVFPASLQEVNSSPSTNDSDTNEPSNNTRSHEIAALDEWLSDLLMVDNASNRVVEGEDQRGQLRGDRGQLRGDRGQLRRGKSAGYKFEILKELMDTQW